MLKKRVITGTTLALVVLALVWLAPATVVATVFGGVALIGAGEWGRLSDLSLVASSFYALGVGGLIGLAAWGLASGLWPTWVLGMALLLWLIPLGQLVAYARGWRQPWARHAQLVLGAVLLPASWLSLAVPLFSRADGGYWLTALFVMVWGSDIGGYFVGRAFGKRPLAVSLSPSKTWEGCIGGVGFAALGMAALIVLVLSLGGFGGAAPWSHLLLVPPVVAAAVAGDLFESLLKRHAGVKDSGWIVAGHGGVLDRLDALLMAAPLYAMLAAVMP